MRHSDNFKSWCEKAGYDINDPEDVLTAELHYQELAFGLALRLFDDETLRQWGIYL